MLESNRAIYRSRGKPKNSPYGSRYSFFFGGASSGKPVNETTAMQMAVVCACVKARSETVAAIPLPVFLPLQKYYVQGITSSGVKG